jgi:uncharacterized damage-inducible protein DinB
VITVEEALKEIAQGRDFDSLAVVLNDLTPEQAVAKPAGFPYSIATIVWHMAFWQDRWLKQIADIHCDHFPDDGSDFPVVAGADWVTTRDRFFAGFADVQERSHHTAVFPKPTQFGDTVEVLLVRTALHTAYHVGQLVLLRRAA